MLTSNTKKKTHNGYMFRLCLIFSNFLSFPSIRLCIMTNHAATLEVLRAAPMELLPRGIVTPCVLALYQSL